MPTSTWQATATYGPYSIATSPLNGRLSIRRKDTDRTRTVAILDSLLGWDRFVMALKSGDDEATAVRAIARPGGS